jgi:hypothetical protein
VRARTSSGESCSSLVPRSSRFGSVVPENLTGRGAIRASLLCRTRCRGDAQGVIMVLVGLPPFMDGGREQHILATGQFVTGGFGSGGMPDVLTRHWDAVKQGLVEVDLAARRPTRWSCANAGKFRSKRSGAIPGRRPLRPMPDPLGVGHLIDCRWERLRPNRLTSCGSACRPTRAHF